VPGPLAMPRPSDGFPRIAGQMEAKSPTDRGRGRPRRCGRPGHSTRRRASMSPPQIPHRLDRAFVAVVSPNEPNRERRRISPNEPSLVEVLQPAKMSDPGRSGRISGRHPGDPAADRSPRTNPARDREGSRRIFPERTRRRRGALSPNEPGNGKARNMGNLLSLDSLSFMHRPPHFPERTRRRCHGFPQTNPTSVARRFPRTNPATILRRSSRTNPTQVRRLFCECTCNASQSFSF
jgi:hypothetical protein